MDLAALVLPVLLALAAQTTVNQESPSSPLREQAAYILGPNDRIMVRCVNADELSPTPIRIDNDGQVTLPFVGRVKLAGLTVSDAEKQLTDQLSKFIRHPQVQLNVVESHSQPVSVLERYAIPEHINWRAGKISPRSCRWLVGSDRTQAEF